MKNFFARILLFFLSAYFLFSCSGKKFVYETGENFPVYGGNLSGDRYSPLDEINLQNVKSLKVAWTYDSRDSVDIKATGRVNEIQCQPIVVDGVLYGTNSRLKLFALNAGTGDQIWKFDPENNKINVNRGVVYWENGDDKRILYTVGSSFYAVNAANGKLVESFGNKGTVDLHEGVDDGLDRDVSSLSVRATSPGIVFKDIFIIGSAVSEGGDAAPGYIRAFDVKTGRLKWVFHTIPQPGEIGYDTWPKDAYKKIGGVNNWSGMVVDEKRGAVYFGTGSPSSDFYGGEREGMNLFGNCIISLDCNTGKLNWYFQTVHHDLWDRDIAQPPNLTTIHKDGKDIDVVVAATKDGLVYVLNRDNGESIFPIEERDVPTDGALPGEKPWPTQKFPLKPKPLSRQVYTEEDISDISPEAQTYLRRQFELYRTDNKFTPPSTKGTIAFGYSGGPEWGGAAVDQNGILYQGTNDNPWVLRMIDTATRNQKLASLSRGNQLYALNCAACHGQNRQGSGTEFPSLININQRRTYDEVQSIVLKGKGRMPSFQHLSQDERDQIVDFLFGATPRMAASLNRKVEETTSDTANKKVVFGFEPRYVIEEWRKLFDPNGYPGVKPPWGTLNAIDLNTGEYLWKVPLGEFPELTAKGIPVTGTESYGGPVVTAGDLIFIAGTRDERIRAFDKKTGEVVWEYQLPAGGFATPVTYSVGGKQYVVIAVGGSRGLKPGGFYIAFSL